MESIYYVLCWACHRRCRHCYESRFRPYAGAALRKVVDEARAAFPLIVGNLPVDMSYLDRAAPDDAAATGFVRRPGRIVLAGGEVLLEPVREAVLLPALEAIAARYSGQGVNVVVQTTGDLVTPAIVEALLTRGVRMISCAGMDQFHVGMEGARGLALQERLRTVFEAAGMREGSDLSGDAPTYGFFGATQDAWIGAIWPRGRAWENGLSTATLADEFCNRWSGGLGFLNRGLSGSEVSIDPDGDVFPCCLKTAAPLGNLREERLEDILDSLVGHPAFEAIAAGRPERMGVAFGWDVARFLRESRADRSDGSVFRNLCVGCDSFHGAVLGAEIARIRATRLAARAGATMN